MRAYPLFAALLLFAGANASCGGDCPSKVCGGPPARLAVITWNAGLGPGMVSLSTPRAPHVAAAVAASDFDVLCLQEVWTAPDQARIIDALGLPEANIFVHDSFGTNDVAEDRCREDDLNGVSACMEEECAGVPDEEATLCAIAHCQDDLFALYLRQPHCMHCLAASAGRSAESIQQGCLSRPTTRVQGGGNGIMLASRWPLLDQEALALPAGGANRVALFARIAVPGGVEVEVACTHLSAGQDISPPHSGFDDWDTERIAQLNMISARLADRAGGLPQLLVGDMNFGRANGEFVTDSHLSSWEESVRLGFSSAAAEVSPPLCSSCGDNNLHGYSGRGSLIDHALLRDPAGCPEAVPSEVGKLYVDPAVIAGYDGMPVETVLSDHYGIRVVFTLR